MMPPGLGVPGGNPMMDPAVIGDDTACAAWVRSERRRTPMEQAKLTQLSDMSRQRYGGTREEDVLIESFNVRGANRITVPMALAMRSSILREAAGDRAACDVKLRDTVMPGGVARKVELVAAVLYGKDCAVLSWRVGGRGLMGFGRSCFKR